MRFCLKKNSFCICLEVLVILVLVVAAFLFLPCTIPPIISLLANPRPRVPLCARLCPTWRSEVCGANGRTYRHQCLARCDGVPWRCRGRCPCREQFPWPNPWGKKGNFCLEENNGFCYYLRRSRQVIER